MSLRARHVVEGTISGLHRSPFHGFNVEFAEYREYSPGDDLRRLDWRVLGRTDRFYVKQYEEESNLRATLVMDASASMRYGSRPAEQVRLRAPPSPPRWPRCWSSSKTRWAWRCSTAQTREVLPPAATQAQLARIIGVLEEAQPDRETELGRVLQTLERADQEARAGRSSSPIC